MGWRNVSPAARQLATFLFFKECGGSTEGAWESFRILYMRSGRELPGSDRSLTFLLILLTGVSHTSLRHVFDTNYPNVLRPSTPFRVPIWSLGM